MSIRSMIGICLLFWSPVAMAQTPPQKPPALKIVDCTTLKSLSKPILAELGVAVRCRLEPASLVCLPGARLAADIFETRDLCLSADDRPIHSPRCVANRALTYNQSIIERARHRVETNAGIEYRWLDLPFNIASRKEVLAQAEPIVKIGPDVCVYLRKDKIYLTRPGRPAMPKSPGK